MVETYECEVCGERHEEGFEHEALIIRAGASNRTADELASVFVSDVCDLIGEEYPSELAEPDGWCEDPDDSEALSDAIGEFEQKLYAAGYSVVWDDGYVIYKRYAVTFFDR